MILYFRALVSETVERIESYHPPGDTVQFQMQYSSGDYVEEEEFFDYGFKDFVADFGGYLGLLLGHSILSFFDFWQELCLKHIN